MKLTDLKPSDIAQNKCVHEDAAGNAYVFYVSGTRVGVRVMKEKTREQSVAAADAVLLGLWLGVGLCGGRVAGVTPAEFGRLANTDEVPGETHPGKLSV